ncbi:type II toxin-antitoxin system Phd/YefM family antitoxin [Burkholderia contaminans]|uniref:Type II toxin-antitoxin system Phd/YefM family antitoxin n=1 Tax=Burkholderia contaminans TaxID=488447 RepID=A0AAP4VF28_9BURK|nr:MULTISPECIES: type II toxin-antitoxin system Phd/YefM family antitoxin [Burkholderia]MBD1412629.1 type II toxin-antitoxin system Phd/YefM family antitoxin [Burkholderia contaminans]MBH9665913.1 type II toxin-antitoxin system Phd/YefM family antitoxin [Burkholderia contaminans]MBH9674537.1 type II toxin-antitoxin system Phd/YefM family antitoxin [Burkholderia contaminans]MBH9704583.1 type II toxin-antitoxin system Phd/YefM family antitoxin [Burkholderia contaminans]MBH9718958.1 type II toxin
MMRTIVERFVEQSPMTIMARLVLQCALHDDWIGAAADAGDEPDGESIREALFALAVDAIASIAAWQRMPDAGVAATPGFGAAVTALHDCMSRWRAGWGRALAKDSVELLLPVASAHNADGAHAVDGMRLRVLDGTGEACSPQAGGCDCGRACDDPARDAAAGGARVLPVYDPELGMIVDLLPCERGWTHERAFVGALLETVRPGELWIVDGRFDTDALLSGWPRRGGAFVLREYGRSAACRPLGGWQEGGVFGDGRVREQSVGMVGEGGVSGAFRRIEWHRAEAPGEVVTLLTDLPAERFDAPQVVALSCRRWRDALPLALEPVTGGAPLGAVPARAALLASGIAAFAYNAFSVMTRVVGGALDLDARDVDRLPSLIAGGVTATYAGMMIALPPDWWQRYDQLPATTLGQIVRMLAVHVDPRSERRRRRDNRLSAKPQALLRAATLERLMHDDGDDPAANVFSLRTIAMATRDFSSNPSKALRHAGEALVMVTKYNRPIALLVSIDDWNRLLGEVRETSFTRLSFDAAVTPQGVRAVGLGELSRV